MPRGNQKLQVTRGGSNPGNYRDGRHIPTANVGTLQGNYVIYEVLFIASSDITRGSNPELF